MSWFELCRNASHQVTSLSAACSHSQDAVSPAQECLAVQMTVLAQRRFGQQPEILPPPYIKIQTSI